MNKPTAIAVLAVFLAACVGAYIWMGNSKLVIVPSQTATSTNTTEQGTTPQPAAQAGTTKPQPVPTPQAPGNTQASDTGRSMSIESFVTKYVAAQMGTSYHVTSVEAHGGAGTVYYDDTSKSYAADFTYSIDDFGAMSIDTFKVRKPQNP